MIFFVNLFVRLALYKIHKYKQKNRNGGSIVHKTGSIKMFQMHAYNKSGSQTNWGVNEETNGFTIDN